MGELENEARAKAINQAKEKAKAISEASDVRLGRVLNIYDTTGPIFAEGLGGSDSRAFAIPTPTIEPGSQEIAITVKIGPVVS